MENAFFRPIKEGYSFIKILFILILPPNFQYDQKISVNYEKYKNRFYSEDHNYF